MRGCEEPSPHGPETWVFGINNDITSDRCPMSMIDYKTSIYMRIYNKYDKGLLPCEGTWLQQPNKVTEIVDLITRETNLINKRIMDDGKKRTRNYSKSKKRG